jgi:predicted ABC-type ATPase
MNNNLRKPELIIIAGPNGSGKTSVTQKFLHHEWSEGTLYINPDVVATNHPSINASRIAKRVMEGGHDVPITKIISRYYKSIENCKAVSSIVDRLYVYDNSVENANAEPLFRLSEGALIKQYKPELPLWAQALLP